MNELNKIKDSYVEMINRYEPNLTLCLKTRPGCQANYNVMYRNLKLMDAFVSRKSLGKNWHKKPEQDRMQGVFILEHGRSRTNPHWHGLLRVPQDDIIDYQFRIKNAWKKLVGETWISSHPEDLAKYTKKTSYYLLKEIHKEDDTDKIVFTNFFRGNYTKTA